MLDYGNGDGIALYFIVVLVKHILEGILCLGW